MPGPLDGIRIIDLTTVIAGPYATQLLGDMGAHVTKVEAPDGDIMRAAGPMRSPGMGAAFLNANRNKEGLVLNLKDLADRDRLLALVDAADVLILNMRPAAAERLGLGGAALMARNPRLIYCAIVGFGQDGPYRDRPAYDDVIQAASGWAALEQQASGEARYAPTIVADKVTGLHASNAITAALLYRATSGRGQAVEVPMFETTVSFLMVEHLAGLTYRPPEGPAGYARLLTPHRRPYATSDGYIAALPYSRAHWQAFFAFAGRADWAAEVADLSDSARAARVGELYARLGECLAERTSAEWLAALEALDIPCAPVNSLEALLDDPHLKAVGLFQAAQHPTEGEVLSVRPPVRFSATPCDIRHLAPPLPRGTGEI
ncbi:CaiB/BaiF CoA transferase family protein [Xanthobacteraceae bacterium A53D]